MSDQMNMNQESIQQSFPSISIPSSINDNGKEEKITSSINSLLNNHENSSTKTSIPLNNPSSTPVTKKRSRRTVRNKIGKESSNKNEPYTIPYSTRSQTQQLRQQVSSMTETSSPSTIESNNATAESTNDVNVVNSQVPTKERKKHCAKCKESASIAKIINSKMDRIEELVRNLKKVTDEISKNSHPSSFTTTNKTFNSLDFSRMSIGDLQNLVMVVTNTIMTTASPEAPNLNIIKTEFDEGTKFLKLETQQ